MALPATNLTLHLDASDTDHIWKSYQALTPYHNGVPADGDTLEVWDDEGTVLGVFSTDTGITSGSAAPIWRATTPLMYLPCIDFDGTDDNFVLKDETGTTTRTLSNLITNSDWTLYVVFYVEAVSGTNGTGTVYNNEALIADSGGYWGMHLRNNSGSYSLQVYNYSSGSGGTNVIETSISLATTYVMKARHTSGNIYVSLNGGAETSTGSGNTDSISGAIYIGHGGLYYNGRIGEIVAYNANQSGGDQTDAMAYLMGRWFAPVPPPSPTPRMFGVFD